MDTFEFTTLILRILNNVYPNKRQAATLKSILKRAARAQSAKHAQERIVTSVLLRISDKAISIH